MKRNQIFQNLCMIKIEPYYDEQYKPCPRICADGQHKLRRRVCAKLVKKSDEIGNLCTNKQYTPTLCLCLRIPVGD